MGKRRRRRPTTDRSQSTQPPQGHTPGIASVELVVGDRVMHRTEFDGHGNVVCDEFTPEGEALACLLFIGDLTRGIGK